MNKAFEKILINLSTLSNYKNPYDSYYDNGMYRATEFENSVRNKTVERAKEIVHEVAEEYNGGWIPCNVRFPRNYTDVLADVRGIGFDSSKDAEMVGYFSENGKWFHSHGMQYIVDGEKTKVMAWQPLPEPYHKNRG